MASELKIKIPITYVKGSEKNRTMFAPSSGVKKGNGTKNIKTKVIDPPTRDNIIKPILLTSCGQSPDYGIPNLLGKRIGLEMEAAPLAGPDDISGFKTLIIVIGGSGKGLGAAGVDIPEEVYDEVVLRGREKGYSDSFPVKLAIQRKQLIVKKVRKL